MNPLHEMNVRDEIRRVLDLGIGMIKIHPPHQLFSPNAYRGELWQLAEIYRECEERGVPVMFHTGTSVFPRARNVFAASAESPHISEEQRAFILDRIKSPLAASNTSGALPD